MLLDRCCRLQRPIHNMLRQTRTVLRRSMQAQQCCIGMVSKKWLTILGVMLTQKSDGQAPFCATYQYAEGRRGYGCAAVTGYNKTVLTTTNPGILPFGESASTSATGSGSDTQQATVTAAVLPASSSEADMTLISGGAIAGAVAGSVLALAAIVGIFLFFRRRHRFKKEQQRLAATSMPERSSSQYMYAQYAKPPPSTLSPPTSPPMHSRHPSDQNYGFQSSPPLSDNDRPWSPETVTNEVAELSVGDETTNIHNR